MARNTFAFFEKLKVGDFVQVLEEGCFHEGAEGKIAKVIEKEENRVRFIFFPRNKDTPDGTNSHRRSCNSAPKLKKLSKKFATAYLIAQQI
jgi:hypothetical protein